MGNPLLDMSAEVDQTFLDKYKLEVLFRYLFYFSRDFFLIRIKSIK